MPLGNRRCSPSRVHPANVTLITLGVADIARASLLREAWLREVKNRESREREFLQCGRCGACAVGAVRRRRWMRTPKRSGPGIVVAQNVASEREVDAAMAAAEAAGARILKQAGKTFWGGYNFYFADPDGHVWEVTYNPHWALDQRGMIALPK